MRDEELSRLRRELARAPDDTGLAVRLAVALARAGEIETAARAYMSLDDRAPDSVREGLGTLLADGSLKAEDAAWLAALFGGDRRRIAERAVAVGRAFARAASPERAKSVLEALARFPDREFLSTLLAFGEVEALRPVARRALAGRDHTIGLSPLAAQARRLRDS